MYFVDQRKIKQTLDYMTDILETFSLYTYDKKVEKLALERMTHTFIEGVLDVGNMMIDGFIMRDPGSYEDIIDILIDEKVLPHEEETVYKELVGWRKALVHDYQTINHADLILFFRNHFRVLSYFANHIHVYLKEELGVANAFSNK